MGLSQSEIADSLKGLEKQGAHGARLLLQTRAEFFARFFDRVRIEGYIRTSVSILSAVSPGWIVEVERFVLSEGNHAVIVKVERI